MAHAGRNLLLVGLAVLSIGYAVDHADAAGTPAHATYAKPTTRLLPRLHELAFGARVMSLVHGRVTVGVLQ